MVNIDPMPYGQANVPLILSTNPTIRDNALAGVIEANLVGFLGRITVTTQAYSFATGKKDSRVIYITPNCAVVDFLVNIKRVFAGVQFTPLQNNGGDITKYVMGLLPQNSADYQQAKQETDSAINNGRRITIAIANDLSDFRISLDQDQSSSCSLI